MDPVIHFEMPYDDANRMKKFYETAFGWQTQSLGAEMGNYVLATTTAVGEGGRPTTPGAINGGFHEKTNMGAHPSVVIAVSDIHDAVRRVNEAGGKVLGEPVDIPGVGPYVSFIDSEGNRVSLLQPKM